MKAVIIDGNGELEIRNIAIPEPSPFDCLVKIDACAICTGTDNSLINHKFPFPVQYPSVLGHESTGKIITVGAHVRKFRVGERVTRPAAILTGETVSGISSAWGGFAEYGLVRDVESANKAGVDSDPMLLLSRISLPDDVDPVAAALSINQREILSIVFRFGLGANSRVVIVGSGYNGFLFSLFCKYYGAGKVIQIGNPRLSSIALSGYSADEYIDYLDENIISKIDDLTEGVGPTHIIDAVGSDRSLSLCKNLLSPATAFGCFGLRDFNETVKLREAVSISNPALPMDTDEAAIVDDWNRLFRVGFFRRPGIKVMSIDHVKEAFNVLACHEAIKIVLTI